MYQIFMDLVVALMCGIITFGIRTIINKIIPFIETKLSETQYAWAAEIISDAVRAYEQTASGSGRGDEKFELVSDFVTRELNKLNIHLSEEQMAILIESAVHAMNSEQIVIEEPTATDYYEAGKYLDEGIKAGITGE